MRRAKLERLSFQAMLGAAASVGIFGCVLEVDSNDGVPQGENVGEDAQAVSYNGHEYTFYLSPKTWPDAQTACLLAGANLVIINDSAEEIFLCGEENSRGGGAWWIGYNDQNTEGTWLWPGAMPSGPYYSNWVFGEPNNWDYDGKTNNADCAADNMTSVSRWADWPCSTPLNFVCETGTSGPSGPYSYTLSNTGSATANTSDRSVYLFANQSITIGTCGVPGSSYSGDTYLRFYNPSGAQLTYNDDACGGLGSNFSYVAPVTGTYIIRAGCYSSGQCSGTVAVIIQ